MSIKKKQKKKLKPTSAASKRSTRVQIDIISSKPLSDLASVLKPVDTKSKEAKDNESSMDDGKGGRIWYPWMWNFGKRKEDK